MEQRYYSKVTVGTKIEKASVGTELLQEVLYWNRDTTARPVLE